MATSKYGRHLYGANKYSRATYTDFNSDTLQLFFDSNTNLTVKHVILLVGNFHIMFPTKAYLTRVFHFRGSTSINIDLSKAGGLVYLGPFWDPDDPRNGFWVPDAPDQGGWSPLPPTTGFWIPDVPSNGPWSRANRVKLPWKAITDG